MHLTQLLCDNVSYHYSQYTKDSLLEYGLSMVYNVPYSPDLNLIEKCYLMFKTKYRSLRLSSIKEGRKMTPKQMIT